MKKSQNNPFRQRQSSVLEIFFTETPISHADLINIHELADKWHKNVNELIIWIANGKLRAYCWYKGRLSRRMNHPAFEKGLPVPPYRSYNPSHAQLVRPDGEDLLPLIGGKKEKTVTLEHFIENSSRRLIPQTSHEISIADLVIKEEEVERMEKDNPNLTRKNKTGPYPTDNSDLFNLARALLNKHYKYNPDEKRSTEPSKLRYKKNGQDYTIKSETALKWLREARNPSGAFDLTNKSSINTFQKIVTIIAFKHYGYVVATPQNTAIEKILKVATDEQLNIAPETLKQWINDATNLQDNP